jgi:hypothetical protein
MSQHVMFRRQPVDQQLAQRHTAITLPAPIRGLIQDENPAYMQPGGAVVLDNWAPTTRGVKLRGGHTLWVDLHTVDAWKNGWAYTVGFEAYDVVDREYWKVAVAHNSAPTGTFAEDRAANPTYWTQTGVVTEILPVISGFEYISGGTHRMFAANETKLFDVSSTNIAVIAKADQSSGNYSASQLANQGGDWLIAVNDAGDYPLRFNGATWEILDHEIEPEPDNLITGPPGTPLEFGRGLTFVWKYRNRFFFIQGGTMNAWYLGLNAVGGALGYIPLSGAATKGGSLLFGATWSIDAGDGIDDKCVFGTTEGELLIFTGNDPNDINNWRQEGRYAVSPPMGKNAHLQIGGDLLLATVDGIVPISAAIQKDSAQLELASITKAIKPLWREEVTAKREWAWTLKKWDEFGGIFVTFPGGTTKRYCGVVNITTGAWCRFTGWDAVCFIRMYSDMFFGTQDGRIMHADQTGLDDGLPYVATMVGGWEMFQSPPNTVVWHQARAAFSANLGEPFIPQLSACTDYVVTIPQPPPSGADPGLAEVWDQGRWDEMRWDQNAPQAPTMRNSMWVSIGATGFSHAPVVQVTVAQQARPQVELVAIGALFERLGTNV